MDFRGDPLGDGIFGEVGVTGLGSRIIPTGKLIYQNILKSCNQYHYVCMIYTGI